MNLLRKIGACELKEPKLTPLGHHSAALPVNVKIGKMFIFGAIFDCWDPVATLAAVMKRSLLLPHQLVEKMKQILQNQPWPWQIQII